MRQRPHRLHGIVVGGGIGGMARAAALERIGISCEVHEQFEELREIGAGLTLWSNALIALGRLDAAERVMALGSRVDRFEVRTPSGQVLAVTPLARRNSSIEAALRAYESLRRRRTTRITVESFRFGRICQFQNPMACWLRNTAAQWIPPSVSWWCREQFLRVKLPVR